MRVPFEMFLRTQAQVGYFMAKPSIPKGYKSQLNLYETQIAIKTVKDFFQRLLADRLDLLRVSAPLFVDPASGMNDNLSGIERPVSFDIKEQNAREAEIVRRSIHGYECYPS